MCFRVLLVFIAILSAYSIHLLLKSAGVVGKLIHFSLVISHLYNQMFLVFQASELMSSSGNGLSVALEKCWLPASLQSTTLAVLLHFLLLAKHLRTFIAGKHYMSTKPISLFFLISYYFLAMSSYLFIVKSELPLVIQAFLSKPENTG